MSIIFILIIISLTLATGFLIAFFWAVKNGQFEDDFTPSVRILFDDEKIVDEAKPIVKKEDEAIDKDAVNQDETNLNEK